MEPRNKERRAQDAEEPVRGRSGSMEQEVKREQGDDVRRSGKELIGGK